MLRGILGGVVLVLVSVYFAYLLAPLVIRVRRRVRVGPRHRPISAASAILLIYVVVLVPAALVWRPARSPIRPAGAAQHFAASGGHQRVGLTIALDPEYDRLLSQAARERADDARRAN